MRPGKAAGAVTASDDDALIVDQLGGTVDDLATSTTPEFQDQISLAVSP
jgi:hypothetical protein